MTKIKLSRLHPFCRQLAISISSGIALPKAILLLSQQTHDKQLQKILKYTQAKLSEGTSFYSAIARYADSFPVVFTETIKVGEKTGRLDIVLRKLADQLEKDHEFISRVKTAMIYPGLQFLVLFGVICLLTFLFVGPEILIKGLLVFGGIILVSYFGLHQIRNTVSGRKSLKKIRNSIPVIGGLCKKIAWARFCRVLALMINSAMPADQAVRQAARSADNPLITKEMRRVESRLRNGDGFAESIVEISSLPLVIKEMMLIGEQTGKMDETLDKAAEWYEEQVRQTLKILPKLIGPAMVLIVGVIVGYLIYRIYIVEYLGILMNIK